MGAGAEIVSAGVVVSHKGAAGHRVLLVHRPKYDDWSFPKGKVDPGEHVTAAAVREAAEETGLRVRLGPRLTTQTYLVRDGRARTKAVHYWVADVLGDDDVAGYHPNAEIDEVRWVPVDRARRRLSYPHDVDTLEEAQRFRKRTDPLAVVRHGAALPRKSWRGDDRDRPLAEAGSRQADLLVPVLGAYGVTAVVSSSATRCTATLTPYAAARGLAVETHDDLTEEHADRATVAGHVKRLLDRGEPAVLCTHRPLVAWALEALGLPDQRLEPSGVLVAHHRRGQVVAAELHHL